MKQFFVFLIIILLLAVGFSLGKPRIASYLLTQELSSEEKVNEILSFQNQSPPDIAPDIANEVVFNNQKIIDLPFKSNLLAELIDNTSKLQTDQEKILGLGDERWIEVNLTQQRLYGWEGNNLVHNYLVSTGRWAPTPTGDFRVWTKLVSTKMSGGSKALGTYYYLPNVPCTMYFYKGYGIHGAYWHNNFGHPMSHGCINVRPDEACNLFNWASVGTRVNIHY